MSDSEELALEDSIIATRARRPNAGNRLKSLLDNVEALEEDEYFVEMEGDEEFEVAESEPERMSDEDDDSENDNEDNDNDDDNDRENEDNVEKEGSARKSKHKKRARAGSDDENFSESDTSDEDEEAEDDDTGEKEFQKQQREERRKESKKNKKRLIDLPFLKKHKTKATSDASSMQPPEKQAPRKERRKDVTASSLQLMSSERRSSRRTAAIRNKEEVLERLKESEARRAQYVAPKRREVQKLTQEQMLAEAEITEAKNRASLLFYVEQEELRRQKQRAAMLAKRVQLRHFVRYNSKSTLFPPRRIFVRQPIELLMARFGTEEDRSEGPSEEPEGSEERDRAGENDGENDGREKGGEHEEQADVSMQDASIEDASMNDTIDDSRASTVPEARGTPLEEEEEESHNDKKAGEDTSLDEQERISAEGTAADHNNDEKDVADISEAGDTNEDSIKAEGGTNDETGELNKEAGENQEGSQEGSQADENSEDYSSSPEVTAATLYGPWLLRAKTTVSVVDLDHSDSFDIPKYEVRRTLFGRQAMSQDEPEAPKKLQCIITGQYAKYIDPVTKIPYASMQAYQIIKLVKSGSLAWNPSLGGGVYTGLREGARHATGVPDVFYQRANAAEATGKVTETVK